MWLKVVALFLLCTFFETFFFYIVKGAFDERSERLISVHGNQCIECQGGIAFDNDENKRPGSYLAKNPTLKRPKRLENKAPGLPVVRYNEIYRSPDDHSEWGIEI